MGFTREFSKLGNHSILNHQHVVMKLIYHNDRSKILLVDLVLNKFHYSWKLEVVACGLQLRLFSSFSSEKTSEYLACLDPTYFFKEPAYPIF